MNKTETKVELLFHVQHAHKVLPVSLAQLLQPRSPLTFRSEQFRDREANRKDCLDKLCGTLRQEALALAPVPTPPAQIARVEQL